MSDPVFINVSSGTSTRTINVEQISSIEPYMMGCKIILKEIKDGKNVEVLSTDSYEAVVQTVRQLLNQKK